MTYYWIALYVIGAIVARSLFVPVMVKQAAKKDEDLDSDTTQIMIGCGTWAMGAFWPFFLVGFVANRISYLILKALKALGWKALNPQQVQKTGKGSTSIQAGRDINGLDSPPVSDALKPQVSRPRTVGEKIKIGLSEDDHET